MLLRARISLIVSLCFLGLVAGLVGINQFSERQADERYRGAYVRGQEAVWQKIVEVQMNRMETVATRVAAEAAVVEAARNGDRAALADSMMAIASAAMSEGVADRIEVIDRAGQLLYGSAGLIDRPTMDAGQLQRAIVEHQTVRAIQQDARRRFMAAVGLPLGDGSQDGAVTVAIGLPTVLEDMRRTLGVDAYVINRRGVMVHGTNQALWALLHPAPLVRQQALEVEGRAGKYYTIATLPLLDSAGRTIAHMVTVKDDTQNQRDRRVIGQATLAVVAGFLLVMLFGLNLYLLNAFAPLDGAISVLNALSQGDTSVTVDGDDKKDEIGRIAAAVAVFREHAIAVQRAERQKEKQRRRQGQLQALRQELDIAHSMQQSILPTSFPDEPHYQIDAVMQPARDVGGDFYDFFPIRENEIGIVVADVSGKGIPAALFMAVSRTVLKATAVTGLSPGDCLVAVNDLLTEENPAELFVTLFYGILDTRSGLLTYANGGHNPPYVLRAEGTLEQVASTDGIALGVMSEMPYDEATLQFGPGDMLVLYTDGVTEALDVAKNEFTDQRLQDSLRYFRGGDAAALVGHVLADVKAFATGAVQADDITIMAVKLKQPPRAGA